MHPEGLPSKFVEEQKANRLREAWFDSISVQRHGGLAPVERDELFAAYRDLQAQGKTHAAIVAEMGPVVDMSHHRSLHRPWEQVEYKVRTGELEPGVHTLGQLITDQKFPDRAERYGRMVSTLGSKKFDSLPTNEILIEVIKDGSRVRSGMMWEEDSMFQRTVDQQSSWHIKVELPENTFVDDEDVLQLRSGRFQVGLLMEARGVTVPAAQDIPHTQTVRSLNRGGESRVISGMILGEGGRVNKITYSRLASRNWQTDIQIDTSLRGLRNAERALRFQGCFAFDVS